jgi:hypothetical protein
VGVADAPVGLPASGVRSSLRELQPYLNFRSDLMYILEDAYNVKPELPRAHHPLMIMLPYLRQGTVLWLKGFSCLETAPGDEPLLYYAPGWLFFSMEDILTSRRTSYVYR